MGVTGWLTACRLQVDSSRDGYLTAEQAAEDMPDDADIWVYMCRPPRDDEHALPGLQEPRHPHEPDSPGAVHRSLRPDPRRAT